MEKVPSRMHPRMKREQKTVEYMIGIYCRDYHLTKGKLCDECHELVPKFDSHRHILALKSS